MRQPGRQGRNGRRKQVSFPATAAGTVIVEPAVVAIEPAVAEIEPAVAAIEAESDAGSSIAGDQTSSVVGDSVGGDSDVDLPRQQRFAPPSRVQGEPERSRGKSSKFNEEPEVGNFGIYCGNWGERASLGDTVRKKRREAHDRQLTKCPGQVLVLLEANEAVSDILNQPAVAGNDDGVGLEKRSTHEWWVQRSQEQKGVLIASRKDNTTSVTVLDWLLHDDHPYTQKGKKSMARSRLMTCSIAFKQNVGHIGKELVVCAAHGHFRTMKSEWPQVWETWWDLVASRLRDYGARILAGDFNMSLTRVAEALRRRGIIADCIAWYPWRHTTLRLHDQPLGFDSCGIFYIGGMVRVTLDWGFERINQLTAVAADLEIIRPDDLDVYEGQNYPGQPWHCYKSVRGAKEKEADKNLNERLVALLTPTTTEEQLDTLTWRQQDTKRFCPYLKWKQKKMHKKEWLVMDEVHPGAHFPLCAFTQNESARSAEAEAKRKEKSQRWLRSRGNKSSAVAEFGEAFPVYLGGGCTPIYQTPDTDLHGYYPQVQGFGSSWGSSWTPWDSSPMWSTNR